MIRPPEVIIQQIKDYSEIATPQALESFTKQIKNDFAARMQVISWSNHLAALYRELAESISA